MGERVNVGYFSVEKDATSCFSNPDCVHPGAEVEIVRLVFRILDVPIQVIDVEKAYGLRYDFGRKLPNGSWSGLIGLLVEGLNDEQSGRGRHHQPVLERDEVVFYSYPTRSFDSVFLVAPPPVTCTRKFIFNIFTTTVWEVLVAVFVLAYITKFVLHVSQNMVTSPQKSFTEAVTSFFWEPVMFPPLSSQFLFVTLLFTTFLIMQFYQTNMLAFLSSPLVYDIPFHTTQEALDGVERGQFFFAALGAQSLLCTPAMCPKFEQATRKNPIRRGETTAAVEQLISKGGIYQSTIDSNLLPGPLSWLTHSQTLLIIRDPNPTSYFVAFSFSKRHRKLRDKFNSALIKVLPAVETITTGHGYDTRKTPFTATAPNPKTPLSLRSHFQQLFVVFGAVVGACVGVLVAEVAFHWLKARCHARTYVLETPKLDVLRGREVVAQ